MSNINRTPYNSIPEEWAFHPTIGPFIRDILEMLRQARDRTGGDDDSIEELEIGELYEPGIQTSDPSEIASDLQGLDESYAQGLLERLEGLESDFEQFLPQSVDTAHIYEEMMGFFDYNDTTGSTSLVANTWTDIPNNGLGSFTNKTFRPKNVNEVLDTSTGYLDFTELPLGSEIIVRNDFTVTPSTNNCLLEARYLLGAGVGEYPLQFWSERLDSGSGVPYQRVTSFPIYMGDDNTQQNPGKMQIRLSTSGTVVNAGVYASVRVK